MAVCCTKLNKHDTDDVNYGYNDQYIPCSDKNWTLEPQEPQKAVTVPSSFPQKGQNMAA